jgi:hypothetical protein
MLQVIILNGRFGPSCHEVAVAPVHMAARACRADTHLAVPSEHLSGRLGLP